MQPLLASVAVCVALGAAVVHAALARLASRAGARARAVVPALGLALLLGVPLAGPVARAWEHGYSTGPPLVAQLPAVDLVLPPRALCIVNFPLGIAAFHLGEGRELWVGDRDSSDDLVNMAAIQPVKSYDGNPNGVHYLSSFLGVLDEEVARVVERARAGEDVFLVLSLGEGKEGAGIARLRETLATEVVLESWPVTVERLTARPEGER